MAIGDLPVTAAQVEAAIGRLVERHPFCRSELLTRTVFQRPVLTLVVGNGPRKVIFSAAHHGNEWITTPLLLQFAEELAEAIETGGQIYDRDARALAEAVTIYMVPLVDPDGVDLVTGAIEPGSVQYGWAENLAANYPDIPFPEGWKANLLGVDLNLQYPAGWEQARRIKFAQGYTLPGPRDFVGVSPLNQPESRALADYTRFIDPALVLAFHSQGKEIYWQFGDIFVPGAEALGQKMAEASGYRLADVPYGSGFAGYKDWFTTVRISQAPKKFVKYECTDIKFFDEFGEEITYMPAAGDVGASVILNNRTDSEVKMKLVAAVYSYSDAIVGVAVEDVVISANENASKTVTVPLAWDNDRAYMEVFAFNNFDDMLPMFDVERLEAMPVRTDR